MITVRVRIISYDIKLNYCKGELLNGDVVDIDPYVGCAIELSDEDYKEGMGGDIVGNEYILTEYHVYKDKIVPDKGGMISL